MGPDAFLVGCNPLKILRYETGSLSVNALWLQTRAALLNSRLMKGKMLAPSRQTSLCSTVVTMVIVEEED